MNQQQRADNLSITGSRLSNASLATTSRSRGQAGSTGCSSGVFGGNGNNSTCPGTSSCPLVCQLAPSATSTSRLRPAGSAQRTHSAKPKLIHSLVAAGNSSQKVWSVPGRTKPYTYSHCRLIRCGATGRWPFGAQMRRTIGTKPRLHSSSAQTSTGRSGSAALNLATRLASFFFPNRLLLGGSGLGVTGPGPLRGEAELTQPFPAGSRMHRRAGQLGDPPGQLGAGPQAAVGGAAEQFALELLLLGSRKSWGATLTAAVTGDGRGAAGIIAMDQLADGVAGETDQFGGLVGRARLVGLAEEPQGLPACLLSSVGARAEGQGKFLVGQMVFQLQSWPWHENLLSGSSSKELDINNSQGDSV